MKVLFVNLFPSGTVARYQLSSYVLKAYVEKECPGVFDISIVNMPAASSCERVAVAIKKREPDVVAYSCYCWNMERVREVLNTIRIETAAVQICGGPEISMRSIGEIPEDMRADYYNIGEGEKATTALLLLLRDGKVDIDSLPPGCVLSSGGILFHGADAENLEDLDEIPSIYLENVIEDRLVNKQQAFLETQRGCKHLCSYCLYHHHRRKPAYYSLSRVKSELTHLIVDRNVSALRFMDATLTSELERSKEIVRHFLKLKNVNGVQLPWTYWEWTYAGVDEEFISLVAQLKDRDSIYNCGTTTPENRLQCYSELLNGYTAINSIGLQSMHAPSLKSVRRSPINWERFSRFMNHVRDYNVVLKIDFILGLPFESKQTFFAGLDSLVPFLHKTDHVLNIHRLQLLSGSDLFDRALDLGLQYQGHLPRYVLSTPDISTQDMIEMSRMSGVFYRTVNSPLRDLFMSAFEQCGNSVEEVCIKILDQAAKSEKNYAKLFSDNVLADEYWGNEIFSDLDSQWLRNALKRIGG